MYKSSYVIKKMDCPSEKSMIEMKLSDIQNIIKKLDFDFKKRELIVYHTKKDEKITSLLNELELESSLNSISEIDNIDFKDDSKEQKKLLIIVLLINFWFFIFEIIFWFISNSMWLIADSFDMLSDSIVYMISLFAIWWTILLKKKVAKYAWIFQIFLAIFWIMEVLRRFFLPEQSVNFIYMIVVSIFAFWANMYCLYLFNKNKSKDAHMQASQIFTSNDLIVNTWVIISWILVYLLGSNIPDLIIGVVVFLVVINGAFKILKLSK